MKQFCSFSEAIREGAKLGPQARGVYFDKHGGSCAFGAGLEAVFGERQDDAREAYRLYPYLDATENVVCCPACATHQSPSRSSLIYHLNDDHKWTREQIADWLENEEEKLGFVTLVESESSSPVEQVVSV